MAARLKFSANLSFLFKEWRFLERYACAARAGKLTLMLFHARAGRHSIACAAFAGFVGVECGVDLYQFSKEELRRAVGEASVQQVLLNAPVGTFALPVERPGLLRCTSDCR